MNCKKCDKELVGRQRKFCCRDHQQSWNNKHKYGYKWQRAYRAMSPRNYLSQLRSYYNRRETLSLDFLEDLYNKQNGKCAISGEILTFTQGTGRCPTNISIDRIDSKIGYDPYNIQLVCHKVNIMKAELSTENLKDWCRKILNG